MRKAKDLIPVSVFAVVIFVVFSRLMSGDGVRHYWVRENPLLEPLKIARAENSTLYFEDGSSRTIHTIKPAASVSQSDLDAFLSVATEQGIVLEGDTVIAEPKFYNWCGTINGAYKWEGTYCRARLDEAAILCGYAVPVESADPAEAYGNWRRAAMLQLRQEWYDPEPERIIAGRGIRYGSQTQTLESTDKDLEYYTSTTRPD